MTPTRPRSRRLLAAATALVALAMIATPAAQATHSGYVMPAHNIYQSGGVTNWYNNSDTAYTLGIGSWFGDGRVALNAIGITARSFDRDPAVFATNPSGDGGDAIEAVTVHAGKSAIYAHHDGGAGAAGYGVFAQADSGNALHGTANSGTGLFASSNSGDGAWATTAGPSKAGVHAEHTGTSTGFGLYATSQIGTGVFAQGSTYGLNGLSGWASGIGVRAANTAGGTALKVDGKTHLNGNVGVGTANPVSKLQVVGNYLQLPVRTGAPPATDCDTAAEAGRMVVRTDTGNIYVCKGATGWRAL